MTNMHLYTLHLYIYGLQREKRDINAQCDVNALVPVFLIYNAVMSMVFTPINYIVPMKKL